MVDRIVLSVERLDVLRPAVPLPAWRDAAGPVVGSPDGPHVPAFDGAGRVVYRRGAARVGHAGSVNGPRSARWASCSSWPDLGCARAKWSFLSLATCTGVPARSSSGQRTSTGSCAAARRRRRRHRAIPPARPWPECLAPRLSPCHSATRRADASVHNRSPIVRLAFRRAGVSLPSAGGPPIPTQLGHADDPARRIPPGNRRGAAPSVPDHHGNLCQGVARRAPRVARPWPVVGAGR